MGQPVTAGPLLRFGTDLLTEIIKEMQSRPQHSWQFLF